MFNLDDFRNENNKEHNLHWPYIPDNLYAILIIGGRGSGKANPLLHLIKEEDDIDKNYLYPKDLRQPKYQFLIEKRENAGIKHLNDLKAIIECSNTMDDVYNNIIDCKPNTKQQTLIVFDDMISSNEKLETLLVTKNFRLLLKNCLINAGN